MGYLAVVRGVFTLVGAAIAGLLIWLTTQIGQGTTGGYWAAQGILAGAGLTMALSQLLGGWTKGGRPLFSLSVFVIAFLPVLVCAGWVLLAGQPSANWFQRHLTDWSDSIAIDGIVDDLRTYLGLLAFGLGLVFGFVFDTSGPRRPAPEPVVTEEPVATAPPAEPDVEPAEPTAEPLPAGTVVERPAEPETRPSSLPSDQG